MNLILAAGIVFGLGLLSCRPLLAFFFALLGITVMAYGSYYLFVAHRYWFPWMIVAVAQIPAALVWSLVYNSFKYYVEKRLLEQSLSVYLSPKRVKQLVNRRELLRPGAEKQMLTILFSDIESFTTLSEGVDSDELARLMNRYFDSAVSDCVFKTDGTVVKYIGDAIFAFWNAPEDQADHQARACEAALLLSQQKIVYSKQGEERSFRTRVGLHTGVANVGNFGSASRIDYTAIGENINLASRMEGLNKYLGTAVLITGDTKPGLDGRFVSRSCGKFVLKGFERAVEVHELIGMGEAAQETRPWRERFEQALKCFQAGDFAKAEEGFRCVLEAKPNDGPSKFYLAQLEELKTQPARPGWRGEVELKEK